jgi:hypothetical protein
MMPNSENDPLRLVFKGLASVTASAIGLESGAVILHGGTNHDLAHGRSYGLEGVRGPPLRAYREPGIQPARNPGLSGRYDQARLAAGASPPARRPSGGSEAFVLTANLTANRSAFVRFRAVLRADFESEARRQRSRAEASS